MLPVNDDSRVTKMRLNAVGLQLGSHHTPGSVRLQDAMYRQVLLRYPQVNTIAQAAVQQWETAWPSELWPWENPPARLLSRAMSEPMLHRGRLGGRPCSLRSCVPR